MADFVRFKVGDFVKPLRGKYDRYNSLWNGRNFGHDYDDYLNDRETFRPFKITDIKWGSRYEFQSSSQAYENNQMIRVDGRNINWMSADNFVLIKSGDNKMAATLAIEVDRPCLVREIKEVLDANGKPVVQAVGDYVEFDSKRAARLYTEEQITQSIREKNDYRRFRIYQEQEISQAKKPEIEFV
jgi:hypothetical protein